MKWKVAFWCLVSHRSMSDPETCGQLVADYVNLLAVLGGDHLEYSTLRLAIRPELRGEILVLRSSKANEVPAGCVQNTQVKARSGH